MKQKKKESSKFNEKVKQKETEFEGGDNFLDTKSLFKLTDRESGGFEQSVFKQGVSNIQFKRGRGDIPPESQTA